MHEDSLSSFKKVIMGIIAWFNAAATFPKVLLMFFSSLIKKNNHFWGEEVMKLSEL
jgi:hypothetical protein